MQGTYIPETNYVRREYGVAAILLFLFVVLMPLVSVFNLLSFCISTFRSMFAVTNMAVFCSSLTSLFPGILLKYLLNVFEKLLLLLSSCQILIISPTFSREFPKILKCQTAWGSKCCMSRDGRTGVTLLTVAFRNFAKTSKSTIALQTSCFLPTCNFLVHVCVQLTPATDGQPQQSAYCLQSPRLPSVEPQKKHSSAISLPQLRT
jgi:hypothetical protein